MRRPRRAHRAAHASPGVASPRTIRSYELVGTLGLGMIIVVPATAAAAALAALAPWHGRAVGQLVPRAGGAASRFVGEPA